MSRSGGAVEQQLLLLLLKEELSREERFEARSLVARFHLPDFLHLARHHFLVPWLCGRGDRFPELFDPAMREALEAIRRAEAPRALHWTDRLLDLLDRFERAGVRALPYKGPALGRLLYGSPADRPFGDLDILVTPRDLPAAERIARGAGFRRRWALTPRQERAFLRSSSHLELILPGEPPVPLDLHWSPLAEHFSVPFDTEGLLEHSGWMDLGGRRVRAFRREELFLLLSIHCVKHRFERLNWLKDLDRLLRLEGGLDGKGLLEPARRLRVERLLGVCLRVLARGLGTPLTPELERAAAARPAAGIADRLLISLQVPPEPLGLFGKARFYLRLREDFRDWVAYGLRLLVILATPTFEEWERWKLPDRWFFLYYLYRPVRLAARRLFGIGRESALHERCGT